MSIAQGHPLWCAHYARKTPSIPVHNGWAKCVGCGVDVSAIRRQLMEGEAKSAQTFRR